MCVCGCVHVCIGLASSHEYVMENTLVKPKRSTSRRASQAKGRHVQQGTVGIVGAASGLPADCRCSVVS